MTFSIAGACAKTGMVGCAISSSSICVTSRCAFVRSGIGVALTQNITNPNLGPLALDLLSDHTTQGSILEALANNDPHIEWRQLGVLGVDGEGITFSGDKALGIHASATGQHCIALGNLLSNAHVPQTMISSFENSSGHLAKRLLTALEAGLKQGGESGPVHAAGLLVAAEPDWPVVDLRVDWSDDPINKLSSIWQEYHLQIEDYILRAEDPSNADSFGVPGDE
ncbi:MAG: DUF1028 domain-containing protein [Pseudomonadota bacterium]